MELRETMKRLIGTRTEAISFWITATLCTLSTVLMIGNLFMHDSKSGQRIYQLLQGILVQEIFISAFFTLWKPREGASPFLKIKLQGIAFLMLCAAWGTYYFFKGSSANENLYHFSLWNLDAPAGSVASVFLSPLSMLFQGGRNFPNVIFVGSCAVFFFLFLAGTSKSSRKPSKLEIQEENAQSSFFIRTLQKRMLQAIGISLVMAAAGAAVWGASGLWIWNFRWSCYLPPVFLSPIIEMFCPLYSILMVKKDQKEREAKIKNTPPEKDLKSCRYFKTRLTFLNILTFFWYGSYVIQFELFWAQHSSAFDPYLVTIIGVLGVYIYILAAGFESNVSHNEGVHRLRKCVPFLYLPLWGLACFRAVRFVDNGCLTPFQVWIGFIFISLGIFYMWVLFKHAVRIRTLVWGAIVLCLISMGVRFLSFWGCEQTIESFLKRSGAIHVEGDARVVRAIPHPEGCKMYDLKKFVRALNILQEMDPKRLTILFGPALEVTKGVLRGVQEVAYQGNTKQKKGERTPDKSGEVVKLETLDMLALLEEKPFVINGKTYKNLSEVPEDVRQTIENLKKQKLPRIPISQVHEVANDIDSVLTLLGLVELKETKGGWYCMKRGLGLDYW